VLAANLGLEAQLLHLAAKLCMINRADKGVFTAEPMRMHRPPISIGTLRCIQNDRMDMQLRILVARDIMRKKAIGQISGWNGARAFGLVTVLRRSPISLRHLGFECEWADAAQI
jgi:hypothetical protein